MSPYSLDNLPPDTIEASGACQAGFHHSCSGYSGPEFDPDLCECQCHEDLLQELSR